jgi:thiamine kinase-like enzyme
MKIEDILRMLNYDYYGSVDDIIITWFDKKHTAKFLDQMPEPEVLTEAWSRIANDIQEELDHILEFYNFVQDAAEKLQEAIDEVEKEWNEEDE